MKWTKTPPTEPGIYWAYDPGSKNRPLQLAHVVGKMVIVGSVFHFDLPGILFSEEPIENLPEIPEVEE